MSILLHLLPKLICESPFEYPWRYKRLTGAEKTVVYMSEQRNFWISVRVKTDNRRWQKIWIYELISWNSSDDALVKSSRFFSEMVQRFTDCFVCQTHEKDSHRKAIIYDHLPSLAKTFVCPYMNAIWGRLLLWSNKRKSANFTINLGLDLSKLRVIRRGCILLRLTLSIPERLDQFRFLGNCPPTLPVS